MTVLADLARFGPEARGPGVSLAEAQAYCRELAQRHYENFTVASWLLPKHLRQHFANIYAYCRWSDDLADETGNAEESLRLLDWWEGELNRCFAGSAVHPVFVALSDTVAEFGIPRDPFADLLVAFRQDQHKTRYADWAEVEAYCRNSANPVGRLVLYLGRCHTPDRLPLSDSVCTGLQLANFCQDVGNDWQRGRIYLPLDEVAACGYTEDDFATKRYNAAFVELMTQQVNRAEALLNAGWPLVPGMPRGLRVDMALFIRGGLAILRRIRRCGYDVWTTRPKVPKWEQVALLLRSQLSW